MPLRFIDGDPSEDGHPCEAALEFRRLSFRYLHREVPADALDLAISLAWIGKAVSRTIEAPKWIEGGVDPNTWEMIRTLAIDADARRLALNTAINGEPVNVLAESLFRIRQSSGFKTSYEAGLKTLEPHPELPVLKRYHQLAAIALQFKGPDLNMSFVKADNLIVLSKFRKTS